MPIEDLVVQDYDFRQGVHKWLVVERLYTPDLSTTDMFYQVRYYNRMSFGSAPGRFFCSCNEVAPGAVPPICDHAQAVARHIISKAGLWEQDRSLMELVCVFWAGND